MIKSLATDQHENRFHALKNDIRVLVAVHEAGHVVMGQLYGIRGPVSLPGIQMRQNVRDISEHVATTLQVSGIGPAGITDICFGGYCGERAFYDEEIVRSGSPAIWVNADRAANDLVAFARKNRIEERASAERRLRHPGGQRRAAVRELYNKYGQGTYKKMLIHRDPLIAIAQELYDYWSAKQFEPCEWRP